ncbi:type IV toxin-antitoxin system AbiEi family antitoxin domain-containing protein [Kocuria palustris]|uniref:type IV toxin-antitoxin system AbiEi family antitoxin domain-containing protein n=1 Tax=Kocuria palustris TaxID=71999 RepID=UPI0024694E45|nr:type IV toxin-antitoxin system AbiEi family antitoxin domain-containing protein [Kocuria palustris]MDH5151814.1 hypothetical protein [Kocuria palustris]
MTSTDRPYAAMIPIAERVTALVHAHPEGVGRSDIAVALGVDPQTVGSALTRAVADGEIRRSRRGYYVPNTLTGASAVTTSGQHSLAGGRMTTAQRHDGIQIKYGRMGRQTGLLIAAADGFGEAFIPREDLPDLRRRLARAQAEIEAR